MIRRRFGVSLALAVASVVGLVAQRGAPPPGQAAPTGTSLVLGRVVDADTGQPLAGVIVSIGGGPASWPATAPAGRPRTALTDTQGRFVFRNLPPASYTLSATVGGTGFSPSGFLVTGVGHQIGAYLSGGYGQRRSGGPMLALELADGEKVGDVVVRLWKGGAIDGTVFDEAGEPLVGVVVSAVRRSSDGRLLTGPTTATDDRGRYHVGTLAPGEYLIVVPQTQVLMPLETIDGILAAPPDPTTLGRFASAGAPSPNVNGIRVGSSVVSTTAPPLYVTNALSPSRQADRLFVYQTTFHSTATAARQASPIAIRSGEERAAVDVHLHPVRAVEVSGTVSDASGPVPNFGVHLLPDSGDGTAVLEVATTATDSRGIFTFPLVPVGSYRLLALRTGSVPSAGRGAPPVEPQRVSEGRGASAAQLVAVGDQNVTGLSLVLRAGPNVRGRIEFQGASDRPRRDPQREMSVSVAAARPLFRAGLAAPAVGIGESPEFSIRGLSPGRYIFQVINVPPGWHLQSIVIGGQDMTDASFAIDDADLTDVVVTLTDQPAELVGTVRGANGAADPHASVFLFPTDRARWSDVRFSARTLRGVRVSNTGAFRVPAMIPGEYFVVAALDEIAGDWPDERLLVKLATVARIVRIDPGGKPSITLTTAEVR